MTGVSGGGFHVYSGSAAAGIGKISADGNAASIGPVGANDAVGAPIYIGDSPIADAPLAGLLGEVIVVPYDLAPADDMHKRIIGYLAAKWGVQQRLAAAHPYRYTAPVTGRTPVPAQLVNRGPAMIPRGPSGSWYEANIFDPRPMVDPFDATKLMMYTTGQMAPVGSGTASIGLWRASKADFVAWTINKSLPNPWTFDRIALQKAAAGQWDGKPGGVRLGSVVYRAGVFYLYYASQLDLTKIGLATSPDGVIFTRLASNPILSPAAQDRIDGTDVGDPFVIYDDGRWTMVYSYRTASDVLPGYRYAISTDGKAWVKSGDGDILSRPRRGLQTESHQVLRRGGRYYMVFEMGGSPADKTPYRNFLAAAEQLKGPYTIKKLLVAERGAGAATTDTLHVATPFLFALDGQGYLFWQGAGDLAQPYYNNRWDLFATQVANALS
ncbi:hypothetical protein HRV97_16615 [Sphingomonas sp. HHU CXW]|uniref:Uncharacterized protein n=1 Tax=Sphingomonas hominis TaxID=2741495 RepID=A0ABX2JM89_9SPHN|nr:hypothetical protein [Sphingomonas hominis]NTS66766.1 hypothetical protein [Sphingomonas hominis]